MSNFYDNGSFWSSFPDKTYPQQAPGNAVQAEPGKVYVSFGWSDGDNIGFDQQPIYDLWHNKARGTVPVGTTLSPTLQELNPPLLDWYYSQMTANDDLECAVSGIQYIFPKDYNDKMFPAWCKLTKQWSHDAGFLDIGFNPAGMSKDKYNTFMRICGSNAAFSIIQLNHPTSIRGAQVRSEEALYNDCIKLGQPNPRGPIFLGFDCTVAGFVGRGGGYTAIKNVADRLQAAYPGRYVFLLQKDQIATMREYYGRLKQ